MFTRWPESPPDIDVAAHAQVDEQADPAQSEDQELASPPDIRDRATLDQVGQFRRGRFCQRALPEQFYACRSDKLSMEACSALPSRRQRAMVSTSGNSGILKGLFAEHFADRPALVRAADDLSQQVRDRLDHQAFSELFRHG